MSFSPLSDLFVLTGEPSGDAYGGAIVAELKRRHPELVCAAMGGPELTRAGAEIEQDIEGLAVMGLVPVLARLPQFVRLGLHMTAQVRARQPRVVLSVDYPGFNLRVARRLADLRASGTRFVHLVAPQVWAWRPRRAKTIARSVDRILCFFPFEPPLFTRFGCAADFIGHPLVDLMAARADATVVRESLGIPPGKRVLLLAPGSREREVGLLLPLFHQVAEALERRHGDLAVVVSCVPDLPRDLYRRHTHYPLIEGRYRELCAASHLGLIASGTATLEAALLGLPHLICYRLDAITAAVARQVVHTPHVGLPNLLLGERVLPEVLQDQLSVERLVAHGERLWEGPARAACLARLAELPQRLGGGGSIGRIADILDQELTLGKHPQSRSHSRLPTVG